jgi:hypothetical protein
VILLAVLTANGAMACRVARALAAGRLASLLAGVLMVTLPFFAKMQGELPILAIGARWRRWTACCGSREVDVSRARCRRVLGWSCRPSAVGVDRALTPGQQVS